VGGGGGGGVGGGGGWGVWHSTHRKRRGLEGGGRAKSGRKHTTAAKLGEGNNLGKQEGPARRPSKKGISKHPKQLDRSQHCEGAPRCRKGQKTKVIDRKGHPTNRKKTTKKKKRWVETFAITRGAAAGIKGR